MLFRFKARAPTVVTRFPRGGYGRLNKNLQKKVFFFINFDFFSNFFTHIKYTPVGQLTACYKHIIHLLAFADGFLYRLIVFAWGLGR